MKFHCYIAQLPDWMKSSAASKSHSLSTAAKIGLGIGVALVAAAVVALLVVCCLRRAHRSRRGQALMRGAAGSKRYSAVSEQAMVESERAFGMDHEYGPRHRDEQVAAESDRLSLDGVGSMHASER